MDTLRVECGAEGCGDSAPVRFFLGQRAVDVHEILDRWAGPGHRYVKLRGGDGVYILRHDETVGGWEMVLYDGGSDPDTRLSST